MNNDLLTVLIQVTSEAACMSLEVAGMQAENQQRMHRGESMAYVEEQFQAVLNRYALGWNNVQERINRARYYEGVTP